VQIFRRGGRWFKIKKARQAGARKGREPSHRLGKTLRLDGPHIAR
jgi:hypothetical protein